MAIESSGAMSPVVAFALVGVLGVGSQWVAWRFKLPAIVLMLAAGLAVGPGLDLFDPQRDIGPLVAPMISLAVAIILFEGGLTLDFAGLRDSARGVWRLVLLGAPLGWLLATLALHYGAGLGWESAAVFGGIMIITGPTVIAPLLRTAKLARRPAALLQWEAIINDPLGALAAVLAFEAVVALRTTTTVGEAIVTLLIGIGVALIAGFAGGFGIAKAFRRAWVPEYMKVPVLFATILAVFTVSDVLLHESGLLAVTVMGIVIANSRLASFEELRRFKENVTILLVSGVFILLAASVDFSMFTRLDWRAAFFLIVAVLVVRPVTVLISLLGTGIPFREQLMVALTGPRGVVLVAVSGLFGERLVGLGVADAALIPPLALALVLATVLLHGFTLKPLANALDLSASQTPGVLILGGSNFTKSLAGSLMRAEIPVLVADPNARHLWRMRTDGIKTFSGDILSEFAEHGVEMMEYETVVAATDNDAYNTLVTTELAPEFGRDRVFQLRRGRDDSARHQLPKTLGGRPFGPEEGYEELERLVRQGWSVRRTKLSEEFDFNSWRNENPEARPLGILSANGALRMLREGAEISVKQDDTIVALRPPDTPEQEAA